MTKQNETQAPVSDEIKAKVRHDTKLLLAGGQSLLIQMDSAGIPVQAFRPVADNACYISKQYVADRYGLSFDQVGEILDALEGDDDGDAETLIAIHNRVVAEARAKAEAENAPKH